MDLVYSKNFRIEITDTDFKKRLKLSSLFEFCQDIADMAADSLGFGISSLNDRFGVAWVLTRMRADVYRMPHLYEELVIETWPIQNGRLIFERDFIVKDSSDTVIAASTSSWVLIDIVTREIKKADVIGFTRSSDRERAIDGRLSKIKPSIETISAYKKVIAYSDIDFNGHINNSKYVGYAMDCFSMDFHRQHEVRSIVIDYINETLPGDVLALRKNIPHETAEPVYIEGLSENSGKPVFRAQILYTKAAIN